MAAIRPPHIFICQEFPYGDMLIPDETVEFGAKLYILIKKYVGITPHIQTDDMKGDPKLIAFLKDIRNRIESMQSDYDDGVNYVISCSPQFPLPGGVLKVAIKIEKIKDCVKNKFPGVFNVMKSIFR